MEVKGDTLITLLPLMIERVGIIVILAFLLSQMKSFRKLVNHEQNLPGKIQLIILFGFFGIISNYTGIEINDQSIVHSEWLTEVGSEHALANTRVMGIGIGGLLGGPWVGLGIGLIAGIHRLSLGGFTAAACAISSVAAGIAAGLLGRQRRMKGGEITPIFAVGIGMIMEAFQMVIILLSAKPFEQALALVKVIGLPMILINGLGSLLFVFILQSIIRDDQRTRVLQTNRAFRITDQTLPFFRKGLNPDSCNAIANIVLNLTNADAIAITDDKQVLAHAGAGSDHHIPLKGLETGLTREALQLGELLIARTKDDIYCMHRDCPLAAAVVLPLKVHQETVGTLKMYFTNPNKLDDVHQELAEGLANLFSTQLELAEAEKQTRLLKDAEIKALQAQVHPHFLFNSINTISVLCRTDSEKARSLLVGLSSFFRSNLQGARQLLIPLEKELEHVHAYLLLEQARFPDRYKMTYSLAPGLEKMLIPPFTLQPLIENTIHHAFSRLNVQGEITITIYTQKRFLYISVQDNGQGISDERILELGKKIVSSEKGTGTAIYNIKQRLDGIYNGRAALSIQSNSCSPGTTIKITIPLDQKGVSD